MSFCNTEIFCCRIYSYDQRNKGYFAPYGLDQTNLVKVVDIDPVKGFNPDYAANCYIQSALGFFIQQITTKLLPKVKGTFLSVFDSVLIEHKPENFGKLSEALKLSFAPLIPDGFKSGNTFWEAAYN